MFVMCRNYVNKIYKVSHKSVIDCCKLMSTHVHVCCETDQNDNRVSLFMSNMRMYTYLKKEFIIMIYYIIFLKKEFIIMIYYIIYLKKEFIIMIYYIIYLFEQLCNLCWSLLLMIYDKSDSNCIQILYLISV